MTGGTWNGALKISWLADKDRTVDDEDRKN